MAGRGEQDVWEPEVMPEPSSSFTIPSIRDDTQLECRIYHPKQSSHRLRTQEVRIATIAHPYTTMGGCFDDHVLYAAGKEFLKHGYILGLFNFRGAGESKGHTSWSGKPEQDDYISFIGFLLYYMDALHQLTVKSPSPVSSLTPIISQVENSNASLQINTTNSITRSSIESSRCERVLVLGGYSYGSHIMRQLPDIHVLLDRFSNPVVGTAAAEIRLRATRLAQARVQTIQLSKPRGRTLTVEPSLSSPVYGGDECEPGTRRLSRESRRSIDVVRQTVEKSRAHFSKRRSASSLVPGSEADTMDYKNLAIPELRYFIISPLLPPLSSFIALSSRWWKTDAASVECLKTHQTLAVWGSKDVFVSSTRLNKWAVSLQHASNSKFRFHEVRDAGHFWLEPGAEMEMKHVLGSWLDDLDGT